MSTFPRHPTLVRTLSHVVHCAWTHLKYVLDYHRV